jgi:hypothetical protein
MARVIGLVVISDSNGVSHRGTYTIEGGVITVRYEADSREATLEGLPPDWPMDAVAEWLLRSLIAKRAKRRDERTS